MIVRYPEYLNLFAPAPNPAPVLEYAIVPEVRENYNRTLREFIELIRQNDAKPLYVIMGGPSRDRPEPATAALLARGGGGLARNGRTGDRLQRRRKQLQGKQRRYVFAHWSALGATLLAQFIDEQALKAMVKPN